MIDQTITAVFINDCYNFFFSEGEFMLQRRRLQGNKKGLVIKGNLRGAFRNDLAHNICPAAADRKLRNLNIQLFLTKKFRDGIAHFYEIISFCHFEFKTPDKDKQ